MNIFVPIELALLRTSVTRQAKIFHLLVLAVASLGILFSGSRGAVAAELLTVVLAMLFFARKKRNHVVTIAGLLICLSIGVFVAQAIAPRLGEVNEEESVGKRFLLWAEAWGMFVDHPVLGIGMGNFRESYDVVEIDAEQGRLDVHNLYIQFLAETGVVGFATFLIFCGYVVRTSLRNMKRFPTFSVEYSTSFAILAAFLSFLVHGTVDFIFISSAEFGGALMILCAMYSRVEHLSKARQITYKVFNQQRSPEPLLPMST